MTAQAQFRLDIDRCTGCSACAIACANENEIGEGLSWREIRTFNAARHPSAPVFHVSMACNHCRDPACMHGCPANAYRKDPETGVVLLEPDHCIGCRYCTWVCPYGAPQFNPATRVMEKCTFCSHRLAEDLEPACVVACPVEALGFSARAESSPLETPGLPEVGIGPSLEIEGTHWLDGPPAMSNHQNHQIEEHGGNPPLPAVSRPGLSLRDEWPLLLLTWTASVLVAWFTASIPRGAVSGPWVFSILGLVSITASTLHLGRPERAWRAILNLRTSWVSREIVLFSGFLGLAMLHALWLPLSRGILWGVAALGFAALFAADKIYDIPGQESPAIPHSAMTTLTGLYLLGLFAWEPWLALPSAVLKIVLYGSSVTRSEAIAWPWSLSRLVLGFVWPAVWFLAWPTAPLLWVVVGPLLGEAIDRARFYVGRRFLSPERQIDYDCQAVVQGSGGPQALPWSARSTAGQAVEMRSL